MSDKFRIHKTGSAVLPWAVDYPEAFADTHFGEACISFDLAVIAFIKASERQCPVCLKGAVVSTEWGWFCGACLQYDVAKGCEAPTAAELAQMAADTRKAGLGRERGSWAAKRAPSVSAYGSGYFSRTHYSKDDPRFLEPTMPGGDHDDQCEAEFIEGAYGWTECGCAGRTTL